MKRKAAIVCCSDARREEEKNRIDQAAELLREMGAEIVFADHIYAPAPECEAADARVRASQLMHFFKNDDITDIFDISGGDTANGVLPYLDYEAISRSRACFYGYSDLTTVINAIYAGSGKSSVLYQLKNISGSCGAAQTKRLGRYLSGEDEELIKPEFSFVSGAHMSGVLIGGNIRCFLKLAGTPYMPDSDGRLVLFEAMGSTLPQVKAFVSQLEQIGIFDRCSGIILGTFTRIEQEGLYDEVTKLFLAAARSRLPVAVTKEIGHGSDSKGLVIGSEITLDTSS